MDLWFDPCEGKDDLIVLSACGVEVDPIGDNTCPHWPLHDQKEQHLLPLRRMLVALDMSGNTSALLNGLKSGCCEILAIVSVVFIH